MLVPAIALGLTAVGQQPVIWTWEATVQEPVIDPHGVTTQTVTLRALMEADAPKVFLSATIFDTLAAMNSEYGSIVDWEIHNSLADLTGDLTTTDGASLYNTNAGQLCLWGPCTYDNPVDVLSFTWQLNADVDLDAPVNVMYATSTHAAWVKAGQDHGDAGAYEADVIHEAVFGWTIVPAPSGAIVLALPVFLCGRRRR